MTPPKKKHWFPTMAVGIVIGIAYVSLLSWLNYFQDRAMTHVDNNVPSWENCVDGKDIMIYGHQKPTFVCTKYERNSIPLDSK